MLERGMRNMCRRWAFLALFFSAAVVVGACGGGGFGESYGHFGKDGPPGQVICYPVAAAQAKPGAPTPAPVCFHF